MEMLKSSKFFKKRKNTGDDIVWRSESHNKEADKRHATAVMAPAPSAILFGKVNQKRWTKKKGEEAKPTRGMERRCYKCSTRHRGRCGRQFQLLPKRCLCCHVGFQYILNKDGIKETRKRRVCYDEHCSLSTTSPSLPIFLR